MNKSLEQRLTALEQRHGAPRPPEIVVYEEDAATGERHEVSRMHPVGPVPYTAIVIRYRSELT